MKVLVICFSIAVLRRKIVVDQCAVTPSLPRGYINLINELGKTTMSVFLVVNNLKIFRLTIYFA